MPPSSRHAQHWVLATLTCGSLLAGRAAHADAETAGPDILSPSLLPGSSPAVLVRAAPATTLTEPPPPSRPDSQARFTRGKAIGLGIVSSVFGLGSVVVDYLPSPSILNLHSHSYYHYGTATLAAVPIAWSSPLDAIEVGDWTVALSTADLGLRYDGARSSSSSLNPYWNATETFVIHHGIYAGYVAYRDARVAGASPRWDDGWRPWTADELIVAPLHWSNLNHPVVWAGVSANAGITAVTVGVELGAKISPLASPSAVARNVFLGTLTSWDAGVIEDPLFRGFFYEELQLSLGRWPARAIDMSLFSLAHVPGDVGAAPLTMIGDVADRLAAGLFFEIAYDQGGLLESVAFHVLWDATNNLITSLVGALPQKQNTLSHDLVPPTPPATLQPGGPAAQPIHQLFSFSLPM